MSTIAEKLALLAQTKAAIKAAIEAKGQVVGDIPFSQYPAKIAAIGTASGYYLYLDGEDSDRSWTEEANGKDGVAYDVTSNGTPYIVSFDSRLSVDLYEEDGDLYLSIYAPENTGTAMISYDSVILGIREDSTVRREVAVSQKGKELFLTLNGNSSGFSVNATADGEVIELTCETNGTPQIQQFEGDAIDSVDIQGDVISIATVPNSSTASREAVVVVCLEEDPAVSITVTVVQAGAAASYYLTVDEEEVALSSSRQTYSVSCNTNGTVIATVMDLEGFISATVNANTLNISVSKNNTGSMRIGSIKLRLAEDSTVTAVVGVTQEST